MDTTLLDAARRTSPGGKPCVLMVDDTPGNLVALSAILDTVDATPCCAASGAEALHWLQDHEAAVILLDVAMPGLDGFETAKLIRLRPRSRNTPIVFITGHEHATKAQLSGYQVGAIDYLVKPLDPGMLRSKVEAFLRLYRQKQELEDTVQALRASEEQVRRLNGELEERVRQRTGLLEAASKELESFSYSVAHNLRAPLRAINGFACQVQEICGEQLPPDAREAFAEIRTAAMRMGELIDDLLNLARLGRQALHRETVEPHALIEAVIAELRPALEGRRVEWSLPPLPACRADRALLRQALVNLIDNAVKFTRPRELAHIAIGSGGDQSHETVYFVKDDGVGFDMQYLHKLFRPFERLHVDPRFEGNGIGLALVKRIIEKHGGRVWAEGAVDRGAIFYFALPGEDPP